MKLVVFRHGIAIDRDDPECPEDRLRELTTKGVRRTRAAAGGLRALGVRPDVVFSSPYLRTEQTARIAGKVLGVDRGRIVLVDSLAPGASPASTLDLVGKADVGCALIVGHAPDVDLLIAAVLGRAVAAVTSLGKAGAASVLLPRAGAETGGVLEWLMTPRALRRLARRG